MELNYKKCKIRWAFLCIESLYLYIIRDWKNSIKKIKFIMIILEILFIKLLNSKLVNIFNNDFVIKCYQRLDLRLNSDI